MTCHSPFVPFVTPVTHLCPMSHHFHSVVQFSSRVMLFLFSVTALTSCLVPFTFPVTLYILHYTVSFMFYRFHPVSSHCLFFSSCHSLDVIMNIMCITPFVSCVFCFLPILHCFCPLSQCLHLVSHHVSPLSNCTYTFYGQQKRDCNCDYCTFQKLLMTGIDWFVRVRVCVCVCFHLGTGVKIHSSLFINFWMIVSVSVLNIKNTF